MFNSYLSPPTLLQTPYTLIYLLIFDGPTSLFLYTQKPTLLTLYFSRRLKCQLKGSVNSIYCSTYQTNLHFKIFVG